MKLKKCIIRLQNFNSCFVHPEIEISQVIKEIESARKEQGEKNDKILSKLFAILQEIPEKTKFVHGLSFEGSPEKTSGDPEKITPGTDTSSADKEVLIKFICKIDNLVSDCIRLL